MAKIVVISKYRYIEISNTLRRMASLVSRLSSLDFRFSRPSTLLCLPYPHNNTLEN